MRILLSNDDGIFSPSLHLLRTAMQEAGHDVRVVAPDSQNSGSGSRITVHEPILTRRLSLLDALGNAFEGIAVYGSPADCVILALNGLVPDFEPELVVSGVNVGANAGMDIHFSGTVGAALQSAMYGIPSLAVSYVARTGFSLDHARLVERMALRMDWTILPHDYVYNLNLPDCPAEKVKGLKICPHSTGWERLDGYEKRLAPDGREYFWMTDPLRHFSLEEEGTDKFWLHRGWASLSPLRIDLNDNAVAQMLKNQDIWSCPSQSPVGNC